MDFHFYQVISSMNKTIQDAHLMVVGGIYQMNLENLKKSGNQVWSVFTFVQIYIIEFQIKIGICQKGVLVTIKA